MSFEEWFKKEFNRDPKEYNETDKKIKSAWLKGYNEAMKEAANYANLVKGGFIGNYH